jgi:hypothetical protein
MQSHAATRIGKDRLKEAIDKMFSSSFIKPSSLFGITKMVLSRGIRG